MLDSTKAQKVTELTAENPTPSISDQPAGQAYWRSLEEHADRPAFRKAVAKEFPGYDPDELLSMSRRKFMKFAAASMALAGVGLSGCRRWPVEHLAPFANRPDNRMPGKPVWYASMQERDGIAHGLLVKAIDGRPIKVEGNPEHPISQGAADIFTQASVLEMYDPQRSRSVLHNAGGGNKRSSWQKFRRFAEGHFPELKNAGGANLALLAEPTSSPTLQRLRDDLKKAYPQATWATYSPVNRDHELAGARAAFGRAVRPQYDLAQAKIIACFDADPLADHPAALKHARDWAKGRKSADEGRMNRLYVAEPTFSNAGTVADERVAAGPGQVGELVRELAAQLGVGAQTANDFSNGESRFLANLAKDLKANAGQSVVMAGPTQPAEVHVLVHAINDHLGNHGTTITFTEEPLVKSEQGYVDQLKSLVGKMDAGDIDTLVILGGNPVFDAPADLGFEAALKKVAHSIHLSLYQDETSVQCTWHINRAHALESWGDGRAWDGTLSVQQPQIKPLFYGKTPAELLATVLGQSESQAEGMALVRGTIQPLAGSVAAWRRTLSEGLLEGSGFKAVAVEFQGSAATRLKSAPAKATGADQYEVIFRPHPTIHDGRYAPNGWLQETPDPVTKLTWDNPARIAIKDAYRLGLGNGDMIELSVGGKSIKLPVFLMQGQAPGVVYLSFGHGRTAAGPVGGDTDTSVGFDTYKLRTTAHLDTASGATLKATGGDYDLAATQNNQLIMPEGMVVKYDYKARLGTKGHSGLLIKEATLAQYKANKYAATGNPHHGTTETAEGRDISLQLYTPPEAGGRDGEVNEHNPLGPRYWNEPHAWGMAIDTNACIGCNACMVGCQSENNVPVVGKAQVLMSREMHWLRIDTYYKGDPEDASGVQAVHQPVACVQCENAPCEQVCPVAATVHDTEGLNVMVYNRCVGTRYCSNNCPYKVRRFNYLDFHARSFKNELNPWLGMPDQEQQAKIDQVTRLRYNPDVTVRMRGVMEKCTYCIQRISRAKIYAENAYQQGERNTSLVKDGEVVTACQSACPTDAIVFGNLNDPDSEVSRLQQHNPRAYKLLESLNTRPRTQHLAKIRNPAPGSNPGMNGAES